MHVTLRTGARFVAVGVDGARDLGAVRAMLQPGVKLLVEVDDDVEARLVRTEANGVVPAPADAEKTGAVPA